MPSQFFGLQIGYSGLTAYQAALNTTGNNIANVETKGYSRQVTNQKASQALRTYTSYGMAGSGTTITSIEQVRNSYYDMKYRNATTSMGEYEIKSLYNSQIENYFNDDGVTIQGFSTIYDKFYNALEDVQNNPGDVSTRTEFIGQAKALCEYFNTAAENLAALQEDTNSQIKTVVEQISSLAEQIATLNHEINIIELKGLAANELRDQRNVLVDELSKYVDVEVSEDPIYTTDATDAEGKPLGEKTGAYKFTVIIAGNQTLVEAYSYRTLEVKARENWDKANQSDADGLYDIYWSDTGMEYYPVNPNYSGQLKGLLQMRDGNNNEYFHGTVTGYGTEDGKNYITVKTSADDEYLQDLSKSTLNATGTIEVGNGEYRFDGWDVEEDTDGTLTYRFYMIDDSMQTLDNSGARRSFEGLKKSVDSYTARGIQPAAEVGQAIDYQGIPYYQEQMNEWIRLFAQSFNTIEQGGEDMNGNPLYGSSIMGTDPVAFFVAKDVNGSNNGEDYTFKDDYDYPDTLVDESVGKKSSSSDSYRQLTAASFAVSDYMLADGSRMATTSTQGKIDLEASDIVVELEKLKSKRNFFRGCTSAEFLNCVLGDVALNANSANVFQANFDNIQSTIENQRLSVSGVDNDEEALNLVKFRNAYNLSAKMIQIMTEIYDRLILETGV
ncbi:MAG: flagellar hook-associated protein FlgK [Lachnospiraceae bacterium]|nr:flagellar hook-associated protein FlgK [Lachnospiraceae bacterium]